MKNNGSQCQPRQLHEFGASKFWLGRGCDRPRLPQDTDTGDTSSLTSESNVIIGCQVVSRDCRIASTCHAVGPFASQPNSGEAACEHVSAGSVSPAKEKEAGNAQHS